MNFEKIFGIIVAGLVFNNKAFQNLLTTKISADAAVLVAAQELDEINPAPNGTIIDALIDLSGVYIELGPQLNESQRTRFKSAVKAITTDADPEIDAKVDNFFDKVLEAGSASVAVTAFVNANVPGDEEPPVEE